MTEENKAYELPKAYDPSAIEERWAEYWTREKLFDVATPDHTQAEAKKFTMLLPPPNVTGRLHMGHMLNQTEMDILTRWHRMSGDTTLWVPGTDHAGIATQMMVERQLASEGTSRQAIGREAFTERTWAWKKQYGSAITDQMRRLGASVDWSREYFTMDEGLSVAVKEAFVRLYEQGLIYRGAYIVNWDPKIQTAVSDLEVETEERIGKLYSIRYPFVDGTGHITIATTNSPTAKSPSSPTSGPNPSSAPEPSRSPPPTTPTTSPSASATTCPSPTSLTPPPKSTSPAATTTAWTASPPATRSSPTLTHSASSPKPKTIP
jgi:valyl-tRNA synthetase